MNYFYKKIDLKLLLALIILVFGLPTTIYAAEPSIGTSETVSNVVAGTDDQSASTAATQANVSEVKASRTLSVGALPGDSETTTIGTCVITFDTNAGVTSDELNCTDNAASIDRDTGAGDTPRTASDIAGIMRTLTNVSDTGHGALTVGGSSTDVTFTTTGTESSATAVTFSDGTGGDISSSSSTTGVIPVAQINTITITGTVDTGDVFTATLPTVGAVTYTVTASDTTTTNIASGLNSAIQASSGYASQDFTSSASTNTVVLTAKVAGTGFTQTSSATNRAAVSLEVVFTPADTSSGYSYTITINDESYTYETSSGDVLQNIVEGLQTLVNADSAVTCTENDVAITCTSAISGTTFSYTTNVSTIATGAEGGVFYGCKDPNASNYDYFSLHQQSLCVYSGQSSVQQTTTPVYDGSSPTAIDLTVRDLKITMIGDDVMKLQQLLNSQGYILAETGAGSPGNETTYFGSLTQKALSDYQSANGIYPTAGYFGPITRNQMKNAGLSGLWW